MIFSYDCEQQFLSGLIKFPDVYPQVSHYVSEDDFFNEVSQVNRTIFCVLKQSLDNTEKIDEIILSERVKSLGIDFEDNINIADYIKALAMRKTSENSVITSAKELKKLSVKRGLCESSNQIIREVKSLPNTASYSEIIDKADSIYNKNINLFQEESDSPTNIFTDMADIMEDRGENPKEESGFMGPHKSINNLYGSLLKPGNITVVVARSGVGKTQFCMDFCTKTSRAYNDVPVLHLDNGEMSQEEIIDRQCAAITGVPLHLIETGKWRSAGKEIVQKMRDGLAKINNSQFYYYNVGGLSVDNMVSLVRRFYYSRVGRGNKMILNFDYIKTTFENFNSKSEWQVVGEMVDKFKRLIQKDIVFEKEPMISMMTSVQSNRAGIVGNRNSNSIIDDESIVSLSDRITQFSSHLFSLRKKTADELQNEHEDFGSHRLTCLKHRHLGEDVSRALSLVEMPDGNKVRNAINLDVVNFNITDKGDMKDLADSMDVEDVTLNTDNNFFNPAPNF
tara:strand:+ start:6515 stop:8035 length:1521 start_codon:yes stop_codon:yes gene_type:complete